ncbi:MAG: Gfo/Idh/MocA family protein [Candidatus Bathyarchaeia archaeon]|jgi:predicted dehydrogenase
MHESFTVGFQEATNISVAIIGLGHWGFKWIKIFDESKACVKACCDMNEDILKKVRIQSPKVTPYLQYEEMLRGDCVDAVYVATPPSTHYKIARECLLAKKHVFVEKPLTTSFVQGLELVKLAKDVNRVLMVGNTYIYNKAIQELKRLINLGEIGPLRYIHSWMTNSIDMWTGKTISNYADVLWDLGPHQISIVNYLMAAEPKAVSATCTRSILNGNASELHDCVILNLHFADNIVATIYLNWLDYTKNRRVFVAGQRGILNCDDISNHHQTKIVVGKFPQSKFDSTTNAFSAYDIDLSNTLKNECEHFLSCVASNSTPITDGEDGVSVVRVLETAQKSIANYGSLEPLI